jgi:hypothetical protein
VLKVLFPLFDKAEESSSWCEFHLVVNILRCKACKEIFVVDVRVRELSCDGNNEEDDLDCLKWWTMCTTHQNVASRERPLQMDMKVGRVTPETQLRDNSLFLP